MHHFIQGLARVGLYAEAYMNGYKAGVADRKDELPVPPGEAFRRECFLVRMSLYMQHGAMPTDNPFLGFTFPGEDPESLAKEGLYSADRLSVRKDK